MTPRNDATPNTPAPAPTPPRPRPPHRHPPADWSTLKMAVPSWRWWAVMFGVTSWACTPPEARDRQGQAKGRPGRPQPPLRFFTSTRRSVSPMLSAPGFRHFPAVGPVAAAAPGGRADDRVQPHRPHLPGLLRAQRPGKPSEADGVLVREPQRQVGHHATHGCELLGLLRGPGTDPAGDDEEPVAAHRAGVAAAGAVQRLRRRARPAGRGPHPAPVDPVRVQGRPARRLPHPRGREPGQVVAAVGRPRTDVSGAAGPAAAGVLRRAVTGRVSGGTTRSALPTRSPTGSNCAHVDRCSGRHAADRRQRVRAGRLLQHPRAGLGVRRPPAADLPGAAAVGVHGGREVPGGHEGGAGSGRRTAGHVREARQPLRPRPGGLPRHAHAAAEGRGAPAGHRPVRRTISVSVPGVAATEQGECRGAGPRGRVGGGQPLPGRSPVLPRRGGVEELLGEPLLREAGAGTGRPEGGVRIQEQRNPQNIDFVLEKQPDSGGMGHYRSCWLKVPPGKVFGQFTGVVVLEVKGEAKGPTLQHSASRSRAAPGSTDRAGRGRDGAELHRPCPARRTGRG